MGIADSMKAMTEDIVASHDLRVKAVGDLVVDTRGMLKEFAQDHKEMSEEQAKNLADFVVELSKDVSNMIKSFQNEHKEMGSALKESLKQSEADRKQGEADRLKNFKDMMRNIQKCIEDIETYVANKLKEFSDAHADMGERLKKDLDKYVAGIVSETKRLLKGFQADRKEVSKELQQMATHWQALTATMAKRRGVKPEVEAKVKARPVEEAIEELEEKEVPLEEKVLDFIEGHPKGVRVGEMEESLGVIRMKLGQIAKRLLEEGKVRKEKNIYLPLG